MGLIFSAQSARLGILPGSSSGSNAKLAASWPCWAFSNHDAMRHASRWSKTGGDPAVTARFAAGLLLALRGSLCLYQGEELGLTEADIRFEDLQDPAGKTFWPDYKGRDGCRTPFPWTDAPDAGFGGGKPWLPVEPAHLPLAVSRQEADEDSMLNFYRKAIRVRQSSEALKHGRHRDHRSQR